MKLLTVTIEIEHCGECPDILDWLDTGMSGHRCVVGKRRRIVLDIWGDIPEFCLLPDKENNVTD